uniref:Hint domain-containing protein n=1 Tax=Rhodoblastus sp. TaxID=1962975 RepID=UPI0026195F9E
MTTYYWANGQKADILTTVDWGGALASGDTGVIGDGTVEILNGDVLPSPLTLDLGASQSSVSSVPTSVLFDLGVALGSGLAINDTNSGGTITRTGSTSPEGAALVISGTVDSQAAINVGAGDVLDIVSDTGPADTFNNSGQINIQGAASNYGVLYIGSQPGSNVALTATYGNISVTNGFLAAAAADSGAGTITLNGNSEALATASLQNTAIDFAGGKNTLALGQTAAGASAYDSVATISGFQQSDKIALLSDGSAGAAAASLSYASGVLNVLNGSNQTVASLDIGANYGNQGFYLWQVWSVDANSALTNYSTQYDIGVGDLWTGGATNPPGDFMAASNWSNGAPTSGGNAIIGVGTAEITAADILPSSLNIAVGALQSSFGAMPTSVLVVSNDTLSSGLSIDDMAVGGSITSPNATQIMGSALVVDGTVTSQATINVGAGDAEFIVANTGTDNFVNQGQINLNGTPGSGGGPGNSAVLYFGAAPNGASGALTATYGAISDSAGFIDANAADSGAGTISLSNGELFVTADLKDTAVQFASGSSGGELALGQTASGAASYQSIGTITGFQQNDDIALLSDGSTAAAPTTLTFNNGVLSVYDGNVVLEKLDVGNNYAGQTFYLTTQTDATDNSFNTNFTTRYDITVGQPYGGTQIASVTVACYCAGTLIATARGDVAVEELRIGDLVRTRSGALRPLKWIGQRAYSARFAGNNPDLLPIRFKAGSLDENVPARDLLVSPKHAMFLDGVLIPAEHLVNGATIVQEAPGEDIHYFHLE